MCGICGMANNDPARRQVRHHTVIKMNQLQTHRGPDEDGWYEDHYCTLAMTRLSIIDLDTGKQPIYNEDRSLLVFQNGEIYNYASLRLKLKEKGHQFRTTSDTEVLVHLYEEYGAEMLSYLNGMFAFCIYDLTRKMLFLARDRFGEKPLHYFFDGHSFLFASELATILQFSGLDRKIDYESLTYFLKASLIPEPLTLFQEIKQLPRGHFMKLENGQLTIKEYYALQYPSKPTILSEEDAISTLRPLLEQAVARQTVSDVPIGCFLSGGIDSSSVVALLQKQSSRRVQTFNVRFEDQAYDESRVARKVAGYWNTDHHEIVVSNYGFSEDLFWEIIQHMGQPFRDTSAMATYWISKEIRKSVKVALSGDGGDELFGGYNVLKWYQQIMSVRQTPVKLREAAMALLNQFSRLPYARNMSKLRQISRGLKTSLLPESKIPVALHEMFTDEHLVTLFGAFFSTNTFEFGRWNVVPDGYENWSNLRKMMYYRLAHILPGNMLVKVDRMSMANSLEVRAPFLDVDLYEASIKLPDHLLRQKGLGKYLLRKIMQKDLPAEVFSHPKQGFNVPLARLQNDQYTSLARDLLFENNPLPDLIESSTLRLLFDSGINTHKRDSRVSGFRSSHQLWMIMQLLGWARKFNVVA